MLPVGVNPRVAAVALLISRSAKQRTNIFEIWTRAVLLAASAANLLSVMIETACFIIFFVFMVVSSPFKSSCAACWFVAEPFGIGSISRRSGVDLTKNWKFLFEPASRDRHEGLNTASRSSLRVGAW